MELTPEKRVANLEERFKTFEQMKDPSVLFHEVQRICRMLNEYLQRVNILENELQKHDHDVVVISDEELRDTWKHSGVKLKEINAMLNMDPTNLSSTSKLVNGAIKDVHLRHKVYKYCRKKMEESGELGDFKASMEKDLM